MVSQVGGSRVSRSPCRTAREGASDGVVRVPDFGWFLSFSGARFGAFGRGFFGAARQGTSSCCPAAVHGQIEPSFLASEIARDWFQFMTEKMLLPR